MCGIVGIIDRKLSAPSLAVQGLKKLEYRGYDSWGIGWLEENLLAKKDLGAISESGFTVRAKSNVALGHTRWATHGKVSTANAHPHSDCQENLLIVHNGIIENYKELKQELEGLGHVFKSQTDSEVISHLLEENLKTQGFLAAFRSTVDTLSGQFAIVVLSKESGDLWACRFNSPLVVGVGKDRLIISSDTQAFDGAIEKRLTLNDLEIVRVKDKVELFKGFNSVEPEFFNFKGLSRQAEKGGFESFTLKEISEQPHALRAALSRSEQDLEAVVDVINSSQGLFLVGAGSAFNAGITASYYFSRIANRHVNIALASEFPNYQHFLTKRTVLLAISQSGETADTLDAVRVAKNKGSKVIALVNAPGSTLESLADHVIYLQVGPEIGVLATKSLTGQIAYLQLLAYAVVGRFKSGKESLIGMVDEVEGMITSEYLTNLKKVANDLVDQEHLYVLGRGLNYPTALEAALKIKEVSYIHAEAFAGGELKHGPIALIEPEIPVLGFVAEDENYYHMISNLNEVRARGGRIIGVAAKNNEVFDSWIKIPASADMTPILAAIPAQLIGYFLAVAKNLNPDRPRNLAKSVTVK